MNYLSFYDLALEPFSNTPTSKFYFDSHQHSQALIRLERIVRQMKGLAVLIGDIGAGKTTLARKLLDHLPESEFEASLLVIIHAGISANWLLTRVAQQLGIQDPAEEKLALLSQLYRRLLQIADSGRKTVVLIDEAQMLKSKELMEEFRGLLNLEIPEQKLITFVFFGLPEIEQNLALDPPLVQRIALRYTLETFDLESCISYMNHRLMLAGANRPIFERSAQEAIYHYTNGSPRLINTLADNALFESALVGLKVITTDMVGKAAQQLGYQPLYMQNCEKGIESTSKPVVGPNMGEEKNFERLDSWDSEDIETILSGIEEKM